MQDSASDRLSSALRRRPALVSLLVAVLLVIAAYPEVVFLGGSMSAIGFTPVVNPSMPRPVVSVLPEGARTAPESRTRDVGAQIWQFEPATKFMHNAMSSGESPWWNPDSAAGSYGPETVADMKLSPFVLVVAALGATAAAFSFVILGFLAVSLYCLQQLFTRSLGLPRLAAVAACILFLLNGWAISDISGSPGGPYLIFPVVLYTLVELQRRPRPARLIAATLAYIAFIATTFIPVAILMLVVIHSVALAIDLWRRDADRDRSTAERAVRGVGRQALVPTVAVLVTSFVWLPDLIALRSGGGDVANMTSRSVETKHPIEWMSILSPISFRDALPDGSYTATLGVVPIVLVIAALPRATGLVRRLLVVTAVIALVALGLHMGVPVLKEIAALPGIRVIRTVYWAAAVGAALTLAAGFAVATALEHGLSVRAGAIAAMVMAVGLAIAVVGAGLGHGIGKVGPPLSFLVMGAIVTLLVVGERRPDRRTLFGGLLVAALALELVAYQNHVRLARIEVEDHLPGYVRFVRDNVGDGRVLSAGRNALYPEWGSVLGIRDISTINVDQLPRYRDFFLAYVNPEEPWLFLQIGRDPEIHFRADPSALDLLSVRYLIVDQDMGTYDREVAARYPRVFIDDQAHIDVYANPEAFPRAYLSPALSDGPPPEPGSGAWSMTAPSTSDAGLLAEAAQDGVPRDAPAETAAPGTARITADHADRVEISVDATQPSVLVLSDSDQSDWSATIDGHPAHLGRVDQILRGVIVPAGASTVVFRYHSHARDVGAVLSITAVLGLVIATGVWSRCRRRSEGGAVSAPST